MRLLIVEDDHFYAQFITEYLQDSGMDVSVVTSAEAALAEDAGSYDGAIVDVMLPNDPALSGISIEESRAGFWTGICVTRQLIKRNPALRIVLFTAAGAGGEAEAWAAQQSVSFVRKDEGIGALTRTLLRLGLGGSPSTPRSFIVHGHDEVALMQLKDYIQNTLKWQEATVLREQPNAGKTIIEKFEDLASKCDCVFVLITPDDRAIASGTNDEKRRSRQNVIFEMGFFCGSLGRNSGKVILLHKGPVELPSDISGVIWIDITNGIKAAGEEIRKEVQSL